jgi:outer membrane lipoprotein
MKNRVGIWIFWGALLFTISCAPFSKELMGRVDPSLTIGQIQKNPPLYVGKMVLWGGVIAETVNQKNETVLKIIQTDLDFQKRPVNPDKSSGRFIIQTPGFLDPAIYTQGRLISVLGEVVGKEVFPLGGIEYTYPVILAKEIQLWEREDVIYPVYPYWNWGPYPYRWYRHPW